MNSIEQIKSIISPVRVLKVDDWRSIAAIVTGLDIQDEFHSHDVELSAIYLLSRYESLTSQPLTKEMFVCEVEEPKGWDTYLIEGRYTEDSLNPDEYGKWLSECKAYQAAQKKILFEGFENMNKSEVTMNEEISVWFPNPVFLIRQKRREKSEIICVPIVSDFIYHIDFYNRTASNPIQINFSDNFINELIK